MVVMMVDNRDGDEWMAHSDVGVFVVIVMREVVIVVMYGCGDSDGV